MEAQETSCRTNRPSQWTSFVAAEEASWLVGPRDAMGPTSQLLDSAGI